MVDRKKSVLNSKAGKTLETVSGIVLVIGIIASIIIIWSSFHDTGSYDHPNDLVFDWSGLASALEVLLGSIFFYAFGKTIASIANHAEAIYKQVNPNSIHDTVLANGAEFLPGDVAIWKNDEGEEQKVTVKDYTTFEDRISQYICELANGKTVKVESFQLEEVPQEE